MKIPAKCSAVQLFLHVAFQSVARLGRFSAFRKIGKGCLVYSERSVQKELGVLCFNELGNPLENVSRSVTRGGSTNPGKCVYEYPPFLSPKWPDCSDTTVKDSLHSAYPSQAAVYVPSPA